MSARRLGLRGRGALLLKLLQYAVEAEDQLTRLCLVEEDTGTGTEEDEQQHATQSGTDLCG